MARRRGNNPYAKPDAHTRAAKAGGYTARSVFKLEEIDRRLRLLKPGMHVLDLGAAPGSWSAYAAERIGKGGRLVAIDLQPLKQLLPEHAVSLVGDAFDEALFETGPLMEAAPYQLVLSDMAPNTTGHRETDKIRSYEVFMRAAAMADRVLEPGGAFVGKIFMSGYFEAARDALRKQFQKVRTLRPEAVRDVSYEVFLVGLGKRASEPPSQHAS
jgi:23S rRNA (uridine2552-2'-O)-methyltransferase